MKIVRRILILATMLGTSAAALAQETEPDPYVLVRTLQHAQDQIAQGSQTAYDLQRKLLDHIGNKFLRFTDIVWMDPKNGEAAAIFALAGGDPQVGKWLLAEPRNRTRLQGDLRGRCGVCLKGL